MISPPTELISPDTRRAEPAQTDPHFHVWIDRVRVLIIKAPRFPTRQSARNTAVRTGMEPGTFRVLKCECPCRLAKTNGVAVAAPPTCHHHEQKRG